MIGKRTYATTSLRLVRPQALPKHMQGDVVELIGLETPEADQGKRQASNLMLSVCCEADLNSKFLLLAVEGDKQRLARFYNGFGFVPIQAEPLLMVRPYLGLANA
jgi:hypothetical protein